MKFEALEIKVCALEAVLAKVEKISSLLSQENAIQAKMLQQVTSLLNKQPSAINSCDRLHPNCAILHKKFNYVKPEQNVDISTNVDVKNKPKKNVVNEPRSPMEKVVNEPRSLMEPPRNLMEPPRSFMDLPAVQQKPSLKEFAQAFAKGSGKNPEQPLDDKEVDALIRAAVKSGTLDPKEIIAVFDSNDNGSPEKVMVENSKQFLDDDEVDALIQAGVRNGTLNPKELIAVFDNNDSGIAEKVMVDRKASIPIGIMETLCDRNASIPIETLETYLEMLANKEIDEYTLQCMLENGIFSDDDNSSTHEEQ